RFSPTMEKTVEYLNASMPNARFYAVELVRFAVDGTGGFGAFEARTVLKPSVNRPVVPGGDRLTEEQILRAIDDEPYRDAVREFLAACTGLGLKPEPGTKGTSLRLVTAYAKKLVSVAWLFPPGVSGWMGFTDLTLGYHPSDANAVPQAKAALEEYVTTLGSLPDAASETRGGHRAYHFSPSAVIADLPAIVGALSDLTRDVNEGATV